MRTGHGISREESEEIEGIGIKRDLAGLPVIYTPEDMDIWYSEDETISRIRAELENMVRGVRRDEREGLVLPGVFNMELLSTGGSRQFDTNAIIDRYDSGIAMTVLADFIFLDRASSKMVRWSFKLTRQNCLRWPAARIWILLQRRSIAREYRI